MSRAVFVEKLTSYLNHPLDVVVNENKSVMLNLLEKKRSYAKLSLHKMFLSAPDTVISAIAHYVRGARGKQHLIRQYIHQNVGALDYTDRVRPSALHSVGLVYDLKTLFDEINQTYFENRLDLFITWYGKRGKKNKQRVTFGTYDAPTRLIRINRLLDHPKVPKYFIASVIFHEMLHHVIPYDTNSKGATCIHGPEFKRREQAFQEYDRAKQWEKENHSLFFK